MVGVGNIVSVGGFGAGGGGANSGIQELNGQIGPIVTLVGTSGILVVPVAPNQINIGYDASGVVGVNGIDVQQIGGDYVIDAASLSGLITPSGGIGGINGQIGPHVEVKGVNGITVTVPDTNCILVDGAGASGVGGTVSKFSASFVGITSGTFNHGFNTLDVIIQVFNENTRVIEADNIIVENGDQVSVLFNTPQTGKVVIV